MTNKNPLPEVDSNGAELQKLEELQKASSQLIMQAYGMRRQIEALPPQLAQVEKQLDQVTTELQSLQKKSAS